jgi:hypothetical protein
MHLRVHGEAEVFLDGEPLRPESAASNGPSSMSTSVGGGQSSTRAGRGVDGPPHQPEDLAARDGGLVFVLPRPDAPRRVCAVRVRPEAGSAGGGLFAAPVRYEMGEGAMAAGSWEEQGLAGYSGGVLYRRTIERPAASGRRLMLDLGRVRGTAEVRLNGAPVGVRIWSPYIFDLTEHVRDGANDLEVVVYNTLGPYLAIASPTRMVFPIQTTSGLLGPARLLEVE